MAEVVAAVEVDIPADAAWAALTAWPDQGAWMPATRVGVVTGDGTRVGDRLEAVTGVGVLAFRDSMEITRWEPPRRCEVRHDGRLVRGVGAFEVLPVGEGRSRVVWSEWLTPPLGLAGQAALLCARPLLVRCLRQALRRLGERVAAAGGGAP